MAASHCYLSDFLRLMVTDPTPVSLNWFYGRKVPPRRRPSFRERLLHRLLRLLGGGERG